MTPQVAIAWIQAWGRTARFAFAATAAVLSPSTYTARMRATAVKQVYFTVWQVFTGYILFTALFSAVVIEITLQAARDYGLSTYALDLVFRVLVLEILPLLTALFVALRSGAAISVFALTIMSGAMALVIAYGSMYGFSPWGFDEFTRAVANAFSPSAMAGFVLRSFAFGAVVAVIPIAAGLDATREMKSAPVAVMGGMVRLFFALGVIEVLSLLIKYA